MREHRMQKVLWQLMMTACNGITEKGKSEVGMRT